MVNKLSVTAKRAATQSYYELQRNRKRFFARKQQRTSLAAAKLRLLGAVAGVALFAALLVAQYAQLVQLNYHTEARSRELRVLQDVGQHLQLEAASLRSPERLEKIALEEIGLQYPGQNQVMMLAAGPSLEAGN